MSSLQSVTNGRFRITPLAVISILAVVLGMFMPTYQGGIHLAHTPALMLAFAAVTLVIMLSMLRALPTLILAPLLGALVYGSAYYLILETYHHHLDDETSAGYWLLAISFWTSSWLFVQQLSHLDFRLNPGLTRLVNILIPTFFGITVLILWELIVVGADIPKVLLPAPSDIGVRLVTSVPTLWADFQQTFLKAVIIGYVLGCGSAFITAIIIDRSPFMRRGLLPIGDYISALPIVGVAPIMVMWFGFDWPSKAAVVIIMTFFPMLVNTVSGLAAADSMQKDLMRTYAADYWQTLFKLRLPMALPFIFNALKINSTLALIGAIVAEFFGTPIVGMGFRISTEVGRMNVDMVWAEIAVAALAGSLFYALVAQAEKAMTFWHPSQRKG